MSTAMLLAMLLIGATWMHCMCLETSWTADKIEKRSRRNTSSESCGIRSSGNSSQSGTGQNALQEGDGNSATGQIIGGETSVDKWPWMAGLSLPSRPHICGAVVIDDRHVITAEHCFNEKTKDPAQWSIHVGDLSLGGSHYGIEELKLHDGYTGDPLYYNDIAIMRLKSSLPSDIVPVCLPTEDSLSEGDNMTAIGWGVLDEADYEPSMDLQEIHDVKVMSNVRCQETIPEIVSSQLCSGDPDGGKGPCVGDSGGPVMTRNQAGQYTVVGLVSFGIKCGMPGVTGVYTRVYSHLQWIQEFIKSGGGGYTEYEKPEDGGEGAAAGGDYV